MNVVPLLVTPRYAGVVPDWSTSWTAFAPWAVRVCTATPLPGVTYTA